MLETLTEEQLGEIIAQANKYKGFADRAATPADTKVIRWFAKTVNALCRSLRAAWAANQQIIEVVDDTNKQIQSLKSENAALRAQLAQAQAENERLASQLKMWQEEQDTKAGYL